MLNVFTYLNTLTQFVSVQDQIYLSPLDTSSNSDTVHHPSLPFKVSNLGLSSSRTYHNSFHNI